jgi:hypothetical protein
MQEKGSKTARWVTAICGAIALSACARVAPAPTVTLTVPDRASANASISAAGDVVAVAWGAANQDGATDIYSAVSRAGGPYVCRAGPRQQRC